MQHSSDEGQRGTGARSGVDRRTLLKTAVGGAVAAGVWVKPTVDDLTVGGYPAMASPNCVSPALNAAVLANWTSDTSFIGWQGVGSGSLGPFGFPAPNGVVPPDYVDANFAPTNRTPIYLVEQDPATGTYTYSQTAATFTSSSFNLTAGSIFTFTFNIRWRNTANHVATQQVEAQWARALAGPWNTAYTLATVTGPVVGFTNVQNQSFSLNISTANAGAYFFRYRFSFNGSVTTNNAQRANDLAVRLPTVTCV